MMKELCAVLLLASAIPAWGAEEGQQPPSSRYEAVMQAQYAAKSVPPPQRAEEAQRVYEIYLKSIGQPAKGGFQDSTGESDVRSR